MRYGVLLIIMAQQLTCSKIYRVLPDECLGQRERFRCAYIQKRRFRHANFQSYCPCRKRRKYIRFKTQRAVNWKSSDHRGAKKINTRIDDARTGLLFIEAGQRAI